MNAICRLCSPPCRVQVEDTGSLVDLPNRPDCPHNEVDYTPRWEVDEAPIITMPGRWKVTLRVDEAGELLVFVENGKAVKGSGMIVDESDTRGDDGPGWISSYRIIPAPD